MRKLRIFLLLIATFIVGFGLTLFLIGYFEPKPGGVKIITKPTAKVYINDKFVGKTPFTTTDDAQQISLKLVPDGPDQGFSPYETKINLVSGIQTVVHREFGLDEDNSSGDVISFERIAGKQAGLVVISSPDNAQVWIDGTSQGFTPYNFNSITTGPHKITVKSLGYKDRTMNIKTLAGLRLTVYAKLAKGENETPSPSPTATPRSGPKKFVVVGNTSTGFLRMRTDPGTKGDEIAELKPGEKYLWLDTDIESGWHKIQYKDPVPGLPEGMTGWVSNDYTKVVEDASSPQNTPTPTASSGQMPLPL